MDKITAMQVNLGNLCNLSCNHCHVSANPRGKNNIEQTTAKLLVEVLKNGFFNTLDLTGGALK